MSTPPEVMSSGQTSAEAARRAADVTPWFSHTVRPARAGLYQREYDDKSLTAAPDYWNGREWILCGLNGIQLWVSKDKRRWRGLCRPAAASRNSKRADLMKKRM